MLLLLFFLNYDVVVVIVVYFVFVKVDHVQALHPLITSTGWGEKLVNEEEMSTPYPIALCIVTEIRFSRGAVRCLGCSSMV